MEATPLVTAIAGSECNKLRANWSLAW